MVVLPFYPRGTETELCTRWLKRAGFLPELLTDQCLIPSRTRRRTRCLAWDMMVSTATTQEIPPQAAV